MPAPKDPIKHAEFCRKIAGKTYKQYEPKLHGVDLKVLDCIKRLS
jgi:hypothetical protein